MLLQTLKFIYNHPYNAGNRFAGILRFVRWQIKSRLTNQPTQYQFTQNAKIYAWKGLAGVTGNIYCGLMEYEDMGFLLHFLRPNDKFFDIGANIGSYTLLASAEVGAHSTCFEPVPSTYQSLINNIALNNIEHITQPHNIGLGKENGNIKFTQGLDTVNHVATEGEMNTIDVPVKKLDDITIGNMPLLIKIDVEGFETEVLNGAENTLQDPQLKAIIIELNGSGSRYGFDEMQIHQKLVHHGFKTYTYNPKQKELVALPSFGMHNTIYIRDVPFVMERLQSANRVKVGNKLV
jgi:FkbM family methyltransferase